MTRQAVKLDHAAFSRVLRAYERTNRGWIDTGIGFPIEVRVNGAKQSGVVRAHRKRGVVEVVLRDSKGRCVITGDGVATKFIHGKVKLTQIAREAS